MEFIVLPEHQIDIETNTFYPKNCIGRNLAGEFKIIKSSVYKGKPVEFQFSKNGCKFLFPKDNTESVKNAIYTVKLDIEDSDTIVLRRRKDEKLCSYVVNGIIKAIRTSSGKFPGVEIFFKDENKHLFKMKINFYFFFNIADQFNFKVDMIGKEKTYIEV